MSANYSDSIGTGYTVCLTTNKYVCTVKRPLRKTSKNQSSNLLQTCTDALMKHTRGISNILYMINLYTVIFLYGHYLYSHFLYSRFLFRPFLYGKFFIRPFYTSSLKLLCSNTSPMSKAQLTSSTSTDEYQSTVQPYQRLFTCPAVLAQGNT